MKSILETRKKGQVSALPMAVIILVVSGVFLVLGIVLLDGVLDSTITGASECNATSIASCGEAAAAINDTILGVGTFGDFFTIIVLAIVITIVIGLLLTMFGGRRIR